jgi:HEAT repeat protein
VSSVLDLMGNAKTGEDTEAIEQALGSLAARDPSKNETIAKIASHLNSANPAQKTALLRVIAALGGPKALEQVRAGLKDSNAEVRAASLRSLSSWSTPDAAPDLLEIARNAEKPAERVVALRGYLALAKLGETPEAQRLEMCREAATIARTPEEKRLLLAALGDINSPKSVEQIVPHLSDDMVKEEAVLAIIGISDRLLKRDNASEFAGALSEPLEKAAGATANQETANRAKSLLEKARK